MMHTRDHLRITDLPRLKVKGWKKLFHANGHEKKVGVAILISDETNFKTKATIREQEGHFLILKGIVQQGHITLVSIYIPNINAPDI